MDAAAAILKQADHVLVVHRDYLEHLTALVHFTVGGEGVPCLFLAVVKLVGLPHLTKQQLGHDHVLLDGLAARAVAHQHRRRQHFRAFLLVLFVCQERVGTKWMVPRKLHLQEAFAVLAEQKVEVEGLEDLLTHRLIIVLLHLSQLFKF